MNLLKLYIKRAWRGPFLLALCCGTLFLLNMLYHGPDELPQYTSLLLVCVGAILLALDFIRFVRRYRAVRELLDRCPAPLDRWPDTADPVDAVWLALAQDLESRRRKTASAASQAQAEAADYYTLWAHQIKTPLAALRLLTQEEPDGALRGAYAAELFKTEQYVDMVLSYARLGSFSSALSPETAELSAIVAAAAKRTAPLFIYQDHTSLLVESCCASVVTDAAWLTFVVEQLLTNAAKYTPSGTVRVALDGPDTLVVEDTGLGIAAEDLPRVCERGFTGGAGRTGQRGTGIGLYLCKEVLAKLGHTLTITSAPGKGTRVAICFARPNLAQD